MSDMMTFFIGYLVGAIVMGISWLLMNKAIPEPKPKKKPEPKPDKTIITKEYT